MAGFSFSSQGSTPPQQRPTSAPSGGTPQSNALNLIQGKPIQPPNMSTPSGPRYAPPPQMSVPTTPVKKQTTQNVDGSVHTTEYHAPVTPGLLGAEKPNSEIDTVAQPNTYSPSGGAIVPTGGSQGTSVSTPTDVPNSSTQSTIPNNSFAAGALPGGTAAGNAAGIGSSQEQQAFNEAQREQGLLRSSINNETSDLNNNRLNPIPIGDQTGRDANIQANYQAQQAKLSSAVGNETNLAGVGNTSQGQGITGLISAGQLSTPSNQYITPGYNQQIIGADGKPVGGGNANTLPADAQNFVSDLAKQVQSGQMTRADAESRLSAYGQPGLESLNTALGSGFNTNASNASAATTATGQQIAAAIPPANQALDALQTAFNNLPGVQSTNIPILNQFTQNAAMLSGVGRDQASAFQGALKEARSRIDGALAGVIGVDAASAQAAALLPDNMVPSEIPQKIAAAKQYLQNQLQSYAGSGQQGNQSSNGNSNSPITWESIVK